MKSDVNDITAAAGEYARDFMPKPRAPRLTPLVFIERPDQLASNRYKCPYHRMVSPCCSVPRRFSRIPIIIVIAIAVAAAEMPVRLKFLFLEAFRAAVYLEAGFASELGHAEHGEGSISVADRADAIIISIKPHDVSGMPSEMHKEGD